MRGKADVTANMNAEDETNSHDARDFIIKRHVMKAALQTAEKLADEANLALRVAEQQRNDMVRQLGQLQDHVDALYQQREFRVRHVQDLSHAIEGV